MLCSNCGEEIGDAKICPNCGFNLNSEAIEEENIKDMPIETCEEIEEENNDINFDEYNNFCTNCGSKIKDDVLFCPNCGTKINYYPIQNIAQPRTKFCQNCGLEIDEKAIVCPHCGVSTGTVNSNKNTAVAFLLNFFLGGILPGIGQIYLGLTKKGIMLIGLYWLGWIGFIILFGIGPYLFLYTNSTSAGLLFFILSLICGLLNIIVYIYALINAIISGHKIENGIYVEDSLFGFSF